jgi:hypothetical protein
MKSFISQAAAGSMFELSINRRTGFVPSGDKRSSRGTAQVLDARE